MSEQASTIEQAAVMAADAAAALASEQELTSNDPQQQQQQQQQQEEELAQDLEQDQSVLDDDATAGRSRSNSSGSENSHARDPRSKLNKRARSRSRSRDRGDNNNNNNNNGPDVVPAGHVRTKGGAVVPRRDGDWDCPNSNCGAHNFASRAVCYRCKTMHPDQDKATAAAGVPPVLRPGDWMCRDCGAHNYATRHQCFKCRSLPPGAAGGYGGGRGGAPPPHSYGGYGGGRRDPYAAHTRDDPYRQPHYAAAHSRSDYGQGNSAGGSVRDGDWMCQSCNGHNYAFRTDCFKCHVPKPANAGAPPAAAPVAAPYGGGSQYGGYQQQQQQHHHPHHHQPYQHQQHQQHQQQQTRPGDWYCPSCQAHNYATRTACYRCHTPGGNGGAPGAGASGGVYQAQNVRPGDWSCPQCQAHNYASRTECFKCRAPKD